MRTKFILAGLAGGVLNFFLGWLVYGILLMKYYEANTIHYDGLMKEMPIMWLLIISCLFTGYFLAFIFDRWAKINTLKGGFTAGVIIGLFLGLMYDLSFLSMWNLYNWQIVVIDVLVAAVVYGITGALVGVILSGKEKSAL